MTLRTTLMAAAVWFLACPIFSGMIPDTEGSNIYKVSIDSHKDAEILSGLEVNAFLTVDGGYLIQSRSEIEDRLVSAGLNYELVARNVVRNQLFLDIRRYREVREKYPALYDDGHLRLLHIDPADQAQISDWQGLAPILSDNLKIVFREPPHLDFSKSTDMLDLDSLAGQVLVDSCQAYVERLQAFQTRWSGTDSCLASRDWLMSKFAEFGYDSVICDTFWSNHTYGGWDLVEAHSVIAYKIGTTYPDHQIVFGAHRDSYPIESPGADDNASGCAAVLEIARIMKDIDTKMTFIFVLFDTEETGLFGSWNYSDRAARNGDSIVLMINTDIIAYDEDTDTVIVSNTPGSPFGQIWHDLADSLPSINITALMNEWAFADGMPFEVNGYNVIELFEHILNPYMHTESDSTTYLDFDYMTRVTRASLVTAYVIDNSYVPDPMLIIGIPGDMPELLNPISSTTFNVAVDSYADAIMIPGSGQLHYSVNEGAYETAPLSEIGGGLFEASLPALPCNSRVRWYISAQEVSGDTFYNLDPDKPHMTATGIEMTVIAEYDFEEYVGWQVYGTATQGLWACAYPHGYGHNAEVPIDYDGSGRCYLTGPESRPWSYLYSDVDNGTTIVRSPAFDMSGGQILIEYARWYSNHYGNAPYSDVFEVKISNDDGQTWSLVETVGPVEQASGSWFLHRFWVNDIIEPTAQMRLRFDASDLGSDSNIEAAVDALRIVRYSCGPPVEIITDVIPDWTSGVPFNLVLEATGGQGTILWDDKFDDLVGTGLTLSAEGILSGTPIVDGPIIFTALATDELIQTEEQEYTLIINPAVVITTESLPAAVVNTAYSYLLTCDGGTGNKVWTDAGGDLAGTGVELQSTGILSGTPTDTGVVVFTAQASDAVGAVTDKSLELHIFMPYICGDANSDDQVNVGDAVYLINYVFKSGQAPDPVCAGNANGDDNVDVGDAVYIIAHIFSGGSPPIEGCCPL